VNLCACLLYRNLPLVARNVPVEFVVVFKESYGSINNVLYSVSVDSGYFLIRVSDSNFDPSVFMVYFVFIWSIIKIRNLGYVHSQVIVLDAYLVFVRYFSKYSVP